MATRGATAQAVVRWWQASRMSDLTTGEVFAQTLSMLSLQLDVAWQAILKDGIVGAG